jgi:phosphoribosylformylglycinamidine synthase subunit PurSL
LGAAAQRMLGDAAGNVDHINRTELYVVNRDLSPEERDQLSKAIVDPATQSTRWVDTQSGSQSGSQSGNEAGPYAEVVLRAGVTDPVGDALAHTASLIGVGPIEARSGTRYDFPATATDVEITAVVNAMLRNDVVNDVAIGTTVAATFAANDAAPPVETVAVRDLTTEQLALLSSDRGLALDPAELAAVQTYFRSIDREPTDVELETIAQTWSEHCSHKTFRAAITTDDGETITPLLKQLRQATDQLALPWVKSAFVDNAGIVAFDETYDVAIKVETHNHPSAVEPFGGANTGVGGVIRDVLGVAADPIAVTDILCFGPEDTAFDQLPAGVMHPRRIREGVIDGIADYGNKLGLPTVAGAIVHHEGFTANPLVFAGCIGLRPVGLELPGPSAGDHIVVLGGATGRDGIRGATFSSATMDATTGDVAGASVQIGDPIVERLVTNALREARDRQLFTAITDCGAGGFSSAIGEIAAELGADVDLDAAPRKYPGLAPWELWLSEAQERMVIAVAPAHLTDLCAVCDAHGVVMADLGTFRSDGQLIVRCGDAIVLQLPGSFLHDGRPQRQMIATRTNATVAPDIRDYAALATRADDLLLAVLAHPDVRSNEDVIRGYDHEILGATVGRPLVGLEQDGPADAAVLAPVSTGSGHGLAIGIGVNCRTGVFDARRMSEAVIDEAIRNIVAVGADPTQVALLDNFSWGDPRRPETLGQLMEAVEGCCAQSLAFRAPFVSGKDSLNNEYLTADGVRRSIPPTLVITAVGRVPVADQLITSDAKHADNVLVMVGADHYDLRGSVLDAVLGRDGGGTVPGADPLSAPRYASIHSVMRDGLVLAAHDVGDGGLAVTIAEMAMGGRCGALVDLASGAPAIAALFSESSGRLVLEVHPDNADDVCARTGGRVIGTTTVDPWLVIHCDGAPAINLSLGQLLSAWKGVR